MLYKKIEEKKGVGGYNIIEGYVIYTLESNDYRLIVEDFLTSGKIFESNEKLVNGYYLYECHLSYVSREQTKTQLINLKTFDRKNIDKILYHLFPNNAHIHQNHYYWFYENENIIYDLISGGIISQIEKNISGFIYLNIKTNLVTIDKKSCLSCYTKTDFSLLWRQDLSEHLNYNLDGKNITGQIKEVKQYKDSLIVISDGGIIRLALETGEILWKIKPYARTMEIVDNTGFVCSSLALYKINLDTGDISGYGWKNHRLPDFEYKGKNYWPIGHRVVYHEGLLWYSVYSSGDSFIVAINPHDGYYEWIHYVDTNEKTDPPQFYGNKMFLLDTGGTLHIYNKTTK